MLIDHVRNAEDDETIVLMECLHWDIIIKGESREVNPESGRFFCTNPGCWQYVPAVFLKPGEVPSWVLKEGES